MFPLTLFTVHLTLPFIFHFILTGHSSSSLNNRQVEHFGFDFDYAINGVHKSRPLHDKPIPTICLKFLQELVAQGRLAEAEFPDQLTVNRYDTAAGILQSFELEKPHDASFSVQLQSTAGNCSLKVRL